MNEKMLILEIGGDGGSIKLIQNGSLYFYTTDETTMMDILPGEFNIEDLVSASKKFTSFDLAMESLIKKFPIFNLYPLNVNSEFQERITTYFKQYLQTNKDHDNYGVDDWKQILNYK